MNNNNWEEEFFERFVRGGIVDASAESVKDFIKSEIESANAQEKQRLLTFIESRQANGWEPKTILESVKNELDFGGFMPNNL